MPPHPGVVDAYQKEGRIAELSKKLSVMQNRVKSVSVKTSPVSTGTMHVPVLLVNFATEYTGSASPALYFNRNGNRMFPGMGIILLSIGLLSAIVFGFRRRSSWSRVAASLCIVFVALAASCGSGSGSSSGISSSAAATFPTDASVYETLLNGSGSSSISVQQYYKDMSNNNLTIQFDVLGPVCVTKSWSYYGANDSSGNDEHLGEFIHEAISLLVSKYPDTDFSKYDNNGDGYIDSIIVIHQGRGEESGADSRTIWSCQSELSSLSSDIDGKIAISNAQGGKIFKGFITVPEYTFKSGDSTVGVFCHELGHVLGLPDQYDTTSVTNGVGVWSLMSAGSWTSADGYTSSSDGSRPAPLLAWERYKIGGSAWVAETTAGTGSYTLSDMESSHAVYKVELNAATSTTAPDSMDQYLLLEGKIASSDSASATSGKWYVPGTGTLVTQIHEGVVYTQWDSTYNNEVNAGHVLVHGIDIVESGSLDCAKNNQRYYPGQLEYGQGYLWTDLAFYGGATDLFSNSSTQTVLTTASLLNASNLCYYKAYTSVSSKTGIPSGVSSITFTDPLAFNLQ